MLAPEKTKESGKLADDKDELKRDTLSAADQQSLQALFAMLPQTPFVQQAAKSSELKLQGDSLAAPLGGQNGSLKATLAALNAQQPTAADARRINPPASTRRV